MYNKLTRILVRDLPREGSCEGCVTRYRLELDMELHFGFCRSTSSLEHQLEDVHGKYLPDDARSGQTANRIFRSLALSTVLPSFTCFWQHLRLKERRSRRWTLSSTAVFLHGRLARSSRALISFSATSRLVMSRSTTTRVPVRSRTFLMSPRSEPGPFNLRNGR